MRVKCTFFAPFFMLTCWQMVELGCARQRKVRVADIAILGWPGRISYLMVWGPRHGIAGIKNFLKFYFCGCCTIHRSLYNIFFERFCTVCQWQRGRFFQISVAETNPSWLSNPDKVRNWALISWHSVKILLHYVEKNTHPCIYRRRIILYLRVA